MFDLTGKHVCYVADCGGITLEACKVLMSKNIAVSICVADMNCKMTQKRALLELYMFDCARSTSLLEILRVGHRSTHNQV